MTSVGLPEVVLAGGLGFMGKQAQQIVVEACRQLKLNATVDLVFGIPKLGTFSLQPVDGSWLRAMMPGVVDYYDGQVCKAVQVLPDRERWTLEIPDMSSRTGPEGDPVWKWRSLDWPYPAPSTSLVATNLAFLQGARATEAARWEDGEWEVFAGPGPEVEKSDMRVISLAMALGIDSSLGSIMDLAIGTGLRREHGSDEWEAWVEQTTD
jgi:hypothetical protein